jgi:hypothetical protein
MSPRSLLVFALTGILLPAAIAGIVLLAGRKRRETFGPGRVGALAFGLAYLAGHVAVLGGLPEWPPQGSNPALFYAGAVAALGAALASPARLSSVVAGTVLGLAHLGAAAWVVGRVISREPSPRPSMFAVAAFLIAAMVTMRFDRVASSSPGPWAPLWMWIVATSASVANLLSGTLIYAQFGAVVAGILGAAVVVGLLHRDTPFARGLVPAAYLQVLALCAAGRILANLPVPSFALLAGAPWLAALLVRGREKQWPEGRQRLVVTAAIVLACGAALALAYADHLERSSAPY